MAMNPKIKIIGRYGEYRIGELISPPGSLRKYLLDLKVAELCEPKPAAKRGPGRPRKNS